jgi:hypothetical protein
MADGRRIRPADIVADGGTAGNAEQLIDAVYSARPAALLKAISLTHHERLHAAKAAENPRYEPPETPSLDYAEVAEAAGLTRENDPVVVSAAIHGGDLNRAWVVYVAEDGVGSHFKGAYPYSDHEGGGKSKQHVSEAESFAESTIGQRLAQQRAEDDENLTSTRKSRKPPIPDDDDDDLDDDDLPFDEDDEGDALPTKALDIKAAIKDAPEDEREDLKARLRAAEEEADTPRQSVLDATEPAGE